MEKRRYTRAEFERVAAMDGATAREIGQELGRSAKSIHYIRGRIARGDWPANPAWSDDEDDVIRAHPTRTAVAMQQKLPGRSAEAISERRRVLGIAIGAGTAAKLDPHSIGNRPLLAKSCSRCGRILSAKWFYFTKTRGGRGWVADCRECRNDGRESTWDRFNDRRDGNDDNFYRKMQQYTADRAVRKGHEYTESDMETLADPTLTILEKALKTQRTYAAVNTACSARDFKSHRAGIGVAENDRWIIENPNGIPIEPDNESEAARADMW